MMSASSHMTNRFVLVRVVWVVAVVLALEDPDIIDLQAFLDGCCSQFCG